MPLTDKQIRAAKPRERPYRLGDGAGLYLEVAPGGAKLWRLRYQIAGRESMTALGRYPEVSLAEARERRAAARAGLRAGRTPAAEAAQRRQEAAVAEASRFEAVAREWHAARLPTWKPVHAADVLDSLERLVFPALGALPVRQITPSMVLAVLRAIEARPAVETAHRVRQRMSAIFVHAIATDRGDADPAAVVKPALMPVERGRQPAITDLAGVREVLARAEAIPAHPATRLALRLLALTATRPGEVQGAGWREFEGLDGPEPLWRIPPERAKMGREHLVPLAPQAVAVVEAARRLSGRHPHLFPNSRHAHKPMSENALGYLLNRAGYHSRHVPHGWRAAFSSIMNERFPADRAVIDLMLSHVSEDRVEAAYNRAQHMPRRRELARLWADMLLDGMPEPATLLAGPRR
ncbi:integrase arm-type DNA-binding domain-containing protein [Roseomonas sp. NAR14]|uniref:Integrase arm-type DNA-binding domain-containing protein n=1 Tax=Roseomonas acroporae TaxID=2937791 RepID=A0A9X1YDC1_9PROT|nr:integrase arm-type DNA-binding domain-containing protein [Roseomonas acroporae]MCK8787690.1 integrase arm-type DNA-binding domain-containing protein [Roseomonas acroporae]